MDFIKKLKEEVSELEADIISKNPNWIYELADVILVSLNYSRHYDLSLESILKHIINFNEQRIKTGESKSR